MCRLAHIFELSLRHGRFPGTLGRVGIGVVADVFVSHFLESRYRRLPALLEYRPGLGQIAGCVHPARNLPIHPG